MTEYLLHFFVLKFWNANPLDLINYEINSSHLEMAQYLYNRIRIILGYRPQERVERFKAQNPSGAEMHGKTTGMA